MSKEEMVTLPDREWYFPGAEQPLEPGSKVVAIVIDQTESRVMNEDFPFGKGLTLEVTEVRWPWMMKVRLLGESTEVMNGKWNYGMKDSDLFWQDQKWNLLLWGQGRTVLVSRICESETDSELSS